MNKQPSTAAVASASAVARKTIAAESTFLNMEVSDAALSSLVSAALSAAYAVDFPIANPPGNKATVDRQHGSHPLDQNRVDEGFEQPEVKKDENNRDFGGKSPGPAQRDPVSSGEPGDDFTV